MQTNLKSRWAKFYYYWQREGLASSLNRVTEFLLFRVYPRPLREAILTYRGTRSGIIRRCPCCDHKGKFGVYGVPLRVDARCPACGSVERHRLFVLALQRGELFVNASALSEPILHFAAEPIIHEHISKLYSDYKTADLYEQADVTLNFEQMELEDDSVGTVIANHVLEHVDDHRAFAEAFRVLKKGGVLIAEVPIVEGWDETYENPLVQSPADRTLHFGQHDHVRYYGRDFRQRGTDAGFELVREVTAEGSDVLDYGLQRGEKVFVFRKPDSDV